jgi:ferric-dicitrate binding protein FerR (iron transport regulator)
MRNKEDISDELILKVLNNEASVPENAIFQEWANRSVQNKKMFLQLERLWLESNGIGDYYSINQGHAWKEVHRRIMPKTNQRLLKPMIKVAAVVAIAYLLGALSMYLLQPKPQQGLVVSKEIYVKAPLGSKTEVELSDGTKVWLNSGSEVHYPAIFDQNQRDIYLVGEAYFDVEKNEAAPFFVHTNDIDIRVLGTRFNVKSYPEEGLVETTLEEGLININKKGSDQVLQLKPREKATFVKNLEKQPAKGAERFVITENVDTELYTSWKNEKLVFKREKFADLAIKLERWYNVQISIGNKKLANEMVTGIFENESIEQALQALRISVPFKYEIKKNQITILPMN